MDGKNKPKVKLSGKDGNIFSLISIASSALKNVGQYYEAKEMSSKCFSSDSYEEALSIIMEYCDVH